MQVFAQAKEERRAIQSQSPRPRRAYRLMDPNGLKLADKLLNRVDGIHSRQRRRVHVARV